jgi:hypothetical protein
MLTFYLGSDFGKVGRGKGESQIVRRKPIKFVLAESGGSHL